MVGHDRVVVSVDAVVGVLAMNAFGAACDPQSFDLFVLEVVMQMHVLAEDILDCAAAVGLEICYCLYHP